MVTVDNHASKLSMSASTTTIDLNAKYFSRLLRPNVTDDTAVGLPFTDRPGKRSARSARMRNFRRFNVFSGTAINPSPGIILSTATTSRQIQFGLKTIF